MMKRWLILCVMAAILFLPASSFAASYQIKKGEMTISFEDPKWIVFTRDNLKGNRDLKDLGTDEKTMRDTMETASAYVVAVKGKEKNRMEIQVRATENEFINNMATLTDKESKSLLAGVDENYQREIDEYASRYVDLGEYRYIEMKGRYDKDEIEVIQYLTFVNGTNYLIAIQKNVSFTKEDLAEINGMMSGIGFKIDPEKAENNVEAYVKAQQDVMKGSQISMPKKIALTAAVVAAILFLLRFMNRRRRR